MRVGAEIVGGEVAGGGARGDHRNLALEGHETFEDAGRSPEVARRRRRRPPGRIITWPLPS